MTTYDELAQLILDQPSLEAARPIIEAALAPGQYDQQLLDALRGNSLAGAEQHVWNSALAAARMAPRPSAVTWHQYGKHFNAKGAYELSQHGLEIAYYAYEWDGDLDGVARAGSTLAYALYINSHYRQAEGIARRASEIFKHDELFFEACKPLLTLHNIYADEQRAVDALAILDEAEALTEMGYSEEHSSRHSRLDVNLADIWINRGRIAEELQDDFAAASAAYAKVEAIFDEGRIVEPSYFHLHLNRAVMALRLGRHTDATIALARAEQSIRDQSIPDRIDLALYRLQQAVMLGDGSDGRQQWREIIQLLGQAGPPTPRYQIQRARATVMAASLPAAMQESGGAFNAGHMLLLLDEAAEVFRQATLLLDAAQARRTQASIAYDTGLPGGDTYLAQARQLLASLPPLPLRQLELRAVAALHMAGEASIADLEGIAAEFEALDDFSAAASLWTAAGRYYEKRPTDARGDAIVAYRRAINAIDQIRGGLRLSNQSVQFLATRSLPYHRLFALLAERIPTAPENAAEALHIHEQGRAQTLLDELLNGGIHQLLARSDAASRKLSALRRELEQAQARIALLRPPHANQSAGWETPEQQVTRQTAEHAYQAALEQLQLEGHEPAAWLRATAADVSAFAELLDGDTALVWHVAVAGGPGGLELWACLLTRQHGLRIERLTKRAHSAQLGSVLQRFIDDWRREWPEKLGRLQRQRKADAAADKRVDDLLRQLFNLFFDPLEPLLAEASIAKLILVPDETLPLLPLHAACDNQGAYLIQRYAISYAPSASVLLHCQRRERQRRPQQGVLLAGWSFGENLPPLTYVSKELKALAAIYEAPFHCDTLSAEQALAALREARIAHLACHGVFPRDSHPRFARLAWGAGTISAHDLYAQQLAADLLVLSACDVGQHGPGVQGLVGAAIVAGASSVVASMWAAHDQSSRRLMKAFHIALEQGHSRAVALQAAQCQLLEAPDSDPGYWAPFFLTGVPGTLPASPKDTISR